MKICIRLLGHSETLYEADRGTAPVIHIQIPNKTITVSHNGILTITLDPDAATLEADKKIQVVELSPGGSLAIVSRWCSVFSGAVCTDKNSCIWNELTGECNQVL